MRVIAGSFVADGRTTRGPIDGRSTEPIYLDVHLPAEARFEQPRPDGHNAFVYPRTRDGFAQAHPGVMKALDTHAAGALSEEGSILLQADVGEGEAAADVSSGATQTLVLLIAGRPIGEPVAQYGREGATRLPQRHFPLGG